jgi:hypothetical protein
VPVVSYKPGCPFALRLRALLSLHRVPHTAVRFRDDEIGAAQVRDVNGGNEISPTVRVGERWLTNPSWRQVADAAQVIPASIIGTVRYQPGCGVILWSSIVHRGERSGDGRADVVGQRWSKSSGIVVGVCAVATAVSLAGCGSSATSDGTAGSSAGSTGAASAKACSAFSAAEVAAFVGVQVGAPQVNGPGGTQCQWTAADGDVNAAVQIVPLDYWEPHSTVTVPGVDGASYVTQALGGWEAGAKEGSTQVVLVSLTGPKVSKDTVTEFLVQALSRL